MSMRLCESQSLELKATTSGLNEGASIENWSITQKEPTASFKEVGKQFISIFERKEDFGKSSEKTTQKILELINTNSSITRKEIASEIGISEDGIKFHLANLKKRGILERIGPDKGGRWHVKKIAKKGRYDDE